ncbi:MAG: flagellar biosynthesis protein FlhB [Anaerolineae bacterium]|nr:flagellar biosynthesis protein FlhB [Anaerolineae bacterium]
MADKTEAPSARRLAEARSRGQVMKSIEINSALVLMAAAWLLQGPGGDLVQGLSEMIRESIKRMSNAEITMVWLRDTFITDIGHFILPLGMIMLGLMIVGVAVTLVQIGFLWADKRQFFDFSRVNPISGFQRLFSTSGLFELLKSTIKLLLIGWVAYSFLQSNMMVILELCQVDLVSGITRWIGLAIDLMFQIASSYLILAVIDYLYQRWQFMRNMRMTKEEVKEEYKQQEGDPTIKGRIKEQQRRMARMRMMAAVPKADVIITNPTHLAVAVKYDMETMHAPKVLAKGAQFVAQKIVEIAKQNNVPVTQNVQLARAMYRNVEIDQEIPAELYMAMAEVLSYVYRLKKRKY